MSALTRTTSCFSSALSSSPSASLEEEVPASCAVANMLTFCRRSSRASASLLAPSSLHFHKASVRRTISRGDDRKTKCRNFIGCHSE